MECTPRVNFTLLILCAGQSIKFKGENWYLLNEFDSSAKFYHKVTIEQLIKDFSIQLPNTYVLGLFSCHRRIIDNTFIENCVASDDEINELPESHSVKTVDETEISASLRGIYSDLNQSGPIRTIK